jgi:hippurate hydrolase
MAVHAGTVMASTNRFEIILRGHGGHAAMPHLTADVIVAASQLVTALQSVVARNLPPMEAAVVSVTQFHAGSAWNILPEKSCLKGTIRSFSTEIQNRAEAAIVRLAQGVAAAHDCDAEVLFTRCYPPTRNSAPEAALCLEVARDLLGEEKVHANAAPSLAAEDFAFMLQERPGCYVWLGNGTGTGTNEAMPPCALHNPHYDFNDAALPIGIAYWVRLVERLLGKH